MKISADMNVSALIQHLTQVQPKQESEGSSAGILNVEPISEMTEKVADSEIDSGAQLLASDIWDAEQNQPATRLTSLASPPATPLENAADWVDYIFGRDPFAI